MRFQSLKRKDFIENVIIFQFSVVRLNIYRQNKKRLITVKRRCVILLHWLSKTMARLNIFASRTERAVMKLSIWEEKIKSF